jgi:hypothetical protein
VLGDQVRYLRIEAGPNPGWFFLRLQFDISEVRGLEEVDSQGIRT